MKCTYLDPKRESRLNHMTGKLHGKLTTIYLPKPTETRFDFFSFRYLLVGLYYECPNEFFSVLRTLKGKGPNGYFMFSMEKYLFVRLSCLYRNMHENCGAAFNINFS